MSNKVRLLKENLTAALGVDVSLIEDRLGQLELIVSPSQYLRVCAVLRDDARLRFEQLIDLCGVDYSLHSGVLGRPHRFGVVLQLLSVSFNWRLRVKVFAENDVFPVLPSVAGIWSSANWYEREAFDFYGLLFDGHPDLRRILTDYGFVGHPFRKDFPLSGFVEMRYDAEQKRVIYQPVTIQPREVTPRIVREDNYAGN